MSISVFANDPIMAALEKRVIDSFGLILQPEPIAVERYFDRLVESIVSQQLSVKVADKIYSRLVELLGEVTPEKILAATEDDLRAVGLSFAKIKYIKSLATAWEHELSSPSTWLGLDNEVLITELTKVKGIGRWTAEMFLLFSLGRSDVFSVGDYGLRTAVKKVYGLSETVTLKEIEMLAEKWSPHRSLASRLLWKSLELGK